MRRSLDAIGAALLACAFVVATAASPATARADEGSTSTGSPAAAAGPAAHGPGSAGKVGGETGATSGTVLRFTRTGAPSLDVDLATLRAGCGERLVSVDDPYYGTRKTFRACPLRKALEVGFGDDPTWLAGRDVVFRATDGYAKPAPGSRVLEDGGFLAFSDADVDGGGAPAFAPIDRKQIDPAPFYVVWTKPGQDPHRFPWPYCLGEIDARQVTDLYPHVAPVGEKEGSPALAGFETFKSDCIACHSINGEGGKIGPDLNVPRSIVEYRPVEQVKEYVRNPASFRYSNMPAHEYLDDRRLDELVAYFQAMSRRKHDPGKGS
ncbi:MAG: c-type cytochrome [Alphaproteobacteria bacterium]